MLPNQEYSVNQRFETSLSFPMSNRGIGQFGEQSYHEHTYEGPFPENNFIPMNNYISQADFLGNNEGCMQPMVLDNFDNFFKKSSNQEFVTLERKLALNNQVQTVQTMATQQADIHTSIESITQPPQTIFDHIQVEEEEEKIFNQQVENSFNNYQEGSFDIIKNKIMFNIQASNSAIDANVIYGSSKSTSIIFAKKRGRGRKPVGNELLTQDFTEGIVTLRRSVFRKFNNLIKSKVDQIKKLIQEKKYGFDDSYIGIINQALEAQVVYKNKPKTQQQDNYQNVTNDPQVQLGPAASINLLAKVAYQYSKKTMETFFLDDRLNNLFKFFAQDIKRMGHESNPNRRGKKFKLQEGTEKFEQLYQSKTSSFFEDNIKHKFEMEVDSLVELANIVKERKYAPTQQRMISSTSKAIKKSGKVSL